MTTNDQLIPTDAMHALLDDDDTAQIIRALLIDADTPDDDLREYANMPISRANIADLRETILLLLDAATPELNDTEFYAARELLTETALSLSLCPLHLIDYAICFDDDDAECRLIRLIHPSHDT